MVEPVSVLGPGNGISWLWVLTVMATEVDTDDDDDDDDDGDVTWCSSVAAVDAGTVDVGFTTSLQPQNISGNLIC